MSSGKKRMFWSERRSVFVVACASPGPTVTSDARSPAPRTKRRAEATTAALLPGATSTGRSRSTLTGSRRPRPGPQTLGYAPRREPSCARSRLSSKLRASPSLCQPMRPSLIAIVGRPNVGKSTLFNRLAGRRRALVDDHPGLTRDRIAEEVEVADRRVLVVDTAGLEGRGERGRAGAEDLHAAVQAQARTAVAEADAVLFVVDGQAGLLPEDAAIARELQRASRPLALVVNKIDTPGHEARTAEFHR